MSVDDGDDASAAPASAGLVAVDTQVADRYRLIERVGMDESGSVEFWLARDSVLARQVGATLVAGSSDGDRSLWAAAMVTALLRWGQFSYPGCPRILDVVGVGHGPDRRGLPEQISVVVVTDWAPGPTLVTFLADGRGDGQSDGALEGPVRDAAAVRGPVEAAVALGMVAPLAAATDAAHDHGLLLGCDRPEVLHVAQAGTRTAHVHLGFLLPDPSRGPGDDVRGLGAMLYALLTGRWPLERAAAGVTPAVEEGGLTDAPPVAPHVLDPAVPTAVSELAMSTLGAAPSGYGVRTAAALHQAIADLLADEQHSRPGVEYDGPADRDAALLLPGTQRLAVPRSVDHSSTPTSGASRWVVRLPRARLLAAAACLVALVAALGVLGVGLRHHGRGVHAATASPPAVAAAPGAAANALSGTAAVVSASVYDPTGQPDNPTQVWQALGTDSKAGWSTDTYLQPFPALKPGIGIMLGFAGPVQLTTLTITSPSTGSELQVRSAPSPTSQLSGTSLMASTTLQAGETVVQLAESQPVTHVLVWITKLGGGGDDNVTQISNLRFERATD